MFTIYLSALVLSLGLSIIMSLSPLALGLWILMLSLSVSIMISCLFSSWFGFILFLIYIGGMLVMFAYFVSIQPNQQFGLKSSFMFSFLVFINLCSNNYMILIDLFSDINWWINSLFNMNNLSVVLLLGFVLFLALVMVVKMTALMMAPLRPYKA